MFKERWASGAFTDQSQFATAILNANAIGQCEALEDFINPDYQQVIGDIDYAIDEANNQHIGIEAPGESGAS